MSHAPTKKPERLHRSELAVPATSERFFSKAATSEADVIFLDLEDAVAPHLKGEAREKAIKALNEIDWGRKTMVVRVNGLDTPWAHRDVIELASRAPRLDLILLPKAGSAADVHFLDQLLTLLERETPRPQPMGIEVLIESAMGVANVEAIAAASPRLEAMIFGVGDYSADMRTKDQVFGRPNPAYAVDGGPGASRSYHLNDQWHFAMARMATACRANGLRPIDGPYADFGDPEGYRACARRASALGLEGKWAIHPSQIAEANTIFSPSEEELAWAHQIEEALRQSHAEGKGAVAVNNSLVDYAHGRVAEHILQRDQAIRAKGTAR